MSDPRTALMAAIYQELSGDAQLAAMLGGQRVYDRVPRGAVPPFVAFSAFDSRTMDGDEPPLVEHAITLDVFSRGYGRREASEIAWRIRLLLHDGTLAPAGHRLVQLLHARTRVRAERDRRSYRATLTFRGLTESAA